MVEAYKHKNIQANKQGNAIFLTKVGEDPSDTESIASRQEVAAQESFLPPIGRQLQISKNNDVSKYEAPPEHEETFEEFEERIEGNMYEVRKGLREGQKEVNLLESEMR